MPPAFRVAPNFRRRRIVCYSVFLATVAAGPFVFAESARHSATPPLAFMMADEKSAAVDESATKSPEKKTDDPEDKRRKRAIAEYAFYLVWGLAAVFALLLLMVIVWGNRIRRETRSNPSKKTTFDPLWYLRKPASGTANKPAENPDDSATEPKSGLDTD